MQVVVNNMLNFETCFLFLCANIWINKNLHSWIVFNAWILDTNWHFVFLDKHILTFCLPFFFSIFSDDLVSATVNFIKQMQANGVRSALNEYQYTISLIIVAATVLLVLVAKCCCGTSSSKEATDEKKKSDKDKKKKTK